MSDPREESNQQAEATPNAEAAETTGACVYFKGTVQFCMISTEAACDKVNGTFYENDNCQNHSDD